MKNSNGIIRLANIDDLAEIRRIYDCAKEYMNENGNPNQWVLGYPPAQMLVDDIEKAQLYVVCNNCNTPHAVFAAIEGVDPTYTVIDGSWRNDSDYVAIHRVASDGYFRGVVCQAVAYVKSVYKKDIRIDTHKDNKTMQKALQDNGFVYCGVIKLQNGSPRNAYQLTE